jgi:NAD(P)-dependent dehydrogenase (short-subunit alcohol dehydrogenase family)
MAETILITGASSGIGEETARALLAAGYIVYAGARRIERMNPLIEAGARALALDVTDDTSMRTAVQSIVRATGRIVNVSSVGGKFGGPFGSWYHATKFAVEGLSDSLRMELRQFGIDVVIIEPGAIISEWNGIARQQLMKHSGNGAYAGSAHAYAKFMESADQSRLPSPASVVAKTIARAVASRKPKTRYATGGGAKPLLFLRRVLPDRAFDAMMLVGARPQKRLSL